ncbi:MAG: hypothetical protein ACTHJM_13030, partial [Marmoricola sp.]
MSLNSEDKSAHGASGGGGGGGIAAHLQAPRLQAGGVGYAAWKPLMDVHLQRTGADGIHTKPLTEAAWCAMVARDEAWKQEAFDAALLLAVTDTKDTAAQALDGSSTSSGDDKKSASKETAAALSAEVKEARKLVSATVERSTRAFGTIYSALPDELRLQVAHLPLGWANGLWLWLETKFQSTEQDSVGELLAQWTTLQQDAEESFDAYRARVSKLNVLLEQAKEKPSARMFSYMLLDRLQPRYKAAVLALKASGQLKDAEKIDWLSVNKFINVHERTEARLDGDDRTAMAARAASRTSRTYKDRVAQGLRGSSPSASAGTAGKARIAAASPSRSAGSASGSGGRGKAGAGRRPLQCFVCDEYGHVSHECPQKPTKRPGTGGNTSAEDAKTVKFREQPRHGGPPASGIM